jgi:hypothetical protein
MTLTVKATMRHIAMDIQGALRNMKPREMVGVFTHDGRELSPAEARAYLKMQAYKGDKLIPCCSDAECPDFDRKGGGCPGHPVYEETLA